MRKYSIIIAALAVSACADGPPVLPDVVYRSIPEALLQACTLPQIPESTAELSDAFVKSYKCAELGNADKAAIRELSK